MAIAKVTTQQEFDAAVDAGDEIHIYTNGFFVILKNQSPRIVTWGTSAPTIVTMESSAPRIEARESSAPRIEARESSAPTIVTRESSAPRIVTRETSAPTIEARESSAPRIVTWGTSAPTIVTWESSAPRIVTWESKKTRDDIWAVCSAAANEVSTLREAIKNGLIDGQLYDGECACLVGTLEKSGAKNTHRDSGRLAEMWFLNIKQGDTPETNQFSKLALQWIDEWLFNVYGRNMSALDA